MDVTPVNRTRNFHNFSLETPEFFDDLFLRFTGSDLPQSRELYSRADAEGRALLCADPGALMSDENRRRRRLRLPSRLASFRLVLSCSSSRVASGPASSPGTRRSSPRSSPRTWPDEVRTFEDYLELEERLFRQLDEQIYAKTATGPEYALVRYSRAARRTRSAGRELEPQLRADPDAPVGGVLLLHGMSDSPYSLRALGETLNRRGYRVLGLRLPGHGTAPSGLRTSPGRTWRPRSAWPWTHLAYALGSKPIHIIGYSTGGPLH